MYKLRIRATKTEVDAANSQKVILANDCSVRSYNHVVVPIIMGYCFHTDPDIQKQEDLDFMSIITHELGIKE